MPRMREIGLLAIVLLCAMGGGLAVAQGDNPGAGLEVVGELGGVARSLVVLSDGGLLLAEGDSLLHLADDGQVLGRAALGRGAVQAFQTRGQLAYVLTEQGVATVALPDLAVVAFQPGGGQALLVGDQAVYVAARAAGIRVGALDRRGLPGMWSMLPTPAPAVDLAVDSAGRTLYAALGEAGVGIYALLPDTLPQPVGSLSAIGPVERVAVAANRLLVTSGSRVLAFDLAEPAAPRALATYTPLHDAADVLLRHEWAYVADRDSGLRRFAIGDLREPDLEAAPLWSGSVHALVDDDRYLFAAAGWDGIVVFDAGRLDATSLHSRVPLPGEVTALAVTQQDNQRWAIAGLGADGLAVIDWRDISAPQTVAHLSLDAPVRAVTLRDGLGIVGLESGDLQVYSLSNLAAPRLLATLQTGGLPQGFAWDGTLLYVAAGDGGLLVVDTIRPAEPVIMGQMLPLRADQPIHDVTLERGKRAYLSAGDTLLIVDVDVVAAPQVLATLDLPSATTAARNFIVYAAGGSAFTTVNAASSNQPVALGVYRALAQIEAMAAEGTAVWLAGSGPDVAAVRLGLDAAFVEQQTVDPSGGGLAGRAVVLAQGSTLLLQEDGQITRIVGEEVQTVRAGLPASEQLAALSESRAFVAGQGWAVLDLTQTAQPQVVAGGDTAGAVLDVQVADGGLVLAQGARGVTVLRDEQSGTPEASATWIPQVGAGISQAAALGDGVVFVAEAGPGASGALRVLAETPLDTITTVPLPGPAYSIALAGGRAYVGYAAETGGGLAVVDVRAPTGGVRTVGTMARAAQGLSVDPVRGLAYAVNGAALSVLDLAQWPEITLLGEVTLPQAMKVVEPVGDRYLVARDSDSVLLLDRAQPAWPQPVAVLPGTVQAVAGSDSVLYLGSMARGLAVVDARVLAGLEERVRVVAPDPVTALWQSDGLLFAGGPGGLHVYDVRDPLTPVPLHNLLLDGGAVTALVGVEDRRGGYTLYAVQAGDLLAVRYTGVDGFTAVMPLADGVAQLLGVTAQRILTVGVDGTLQITALAGSQQAAWQIRYPLSGGRVTSGMMWQGHALIGTGRDVTALELPVAEGVPPVVTGQLEGLEAVPSTLEFDVDGGLWLGGDQHLWQVDAHDPAQLSILNSRTVLGGVADVAVIPERAELAVASGACGVRVLDDETLGEVGFWSGEWPVSAVVAGSGDRLAAAGEGGFMLLRRVDDGAVQLALPALPQPTQGAVLAESITTLRWQTPVDGCALVAYEVWMGQGGAPLVQIGTVETPAFVVQDLPVADTVRWQIRVVDDSGRVVDGPVWSFTTDRDETMPSAVESARLTAAMATPTAVSPAAVPAPQDTERLVDPRVLVPLLVGGLVLEVILVGGLWFWWRSRRRMR